MIRKICSVFISGKCRYALMTTAFAMAAMGTAGHAGAQSEAPRPGLEVETALPTVEAGDVAVPTGNREAGKLAARMNDLLRSYRGCVELENRMGRLRCYDDLAVDLQLMEDPRRQEERKALGSYGFWQLYGERDQLGTETFYMILQPYNRLRMATGGGSVPTFNIRCRQAKTDAYIDWKRTLHPRPQSQRTHNLSYRVDNEPERYEAWQLSLDGLAAFSPQPVEFIKYLRGKRLMLVRITPAGQALETLSFELTGLEQALDVLVKRCY